ncbi:MAG: trypsin-like peptidase domain-containing protein [Saprospiraceae bacterium]|jgi:serine protease Do|nr:trypsin-like peptidase domain-containing protein [Saprospiraceae bacterium]
MKQLGLFILISVSSALFAIGLYRAFAPPSTIIIQDEHNGQFTRSLLPIDPAFQMEEGKYLAPVDFTHTAALVTPTVVNIKSTRGGDYSLFQLDAPSSTGSGVIISSNGFIVTNNHVIEGGESIEVTLHDKREYKATLIGVDKSTDIALLRIAAEDLEYVRFANSDSLQVGEWVVAVGNPFNLESTVTAGIVSAKGRSINILNDTYRIESFIQTDAVINPGNSGGALVNNRGGLVGINTAIVTKSGNYEGYSFAIPSNLALKVVRDLKEFGTVQRGFLGVNVENLNQETAKSVGMKPGDGVLITGVNQGGAAYEIGLQKGDILYSINKNKVSSVPQLQENVARYRPGEKLKILYFRNGKPLEAEVILKEIQQELSVLDPRAASILQGTGLEVRELTRVEINTYGACGGIVQSVQRDSPADQVNIESGFLIKKINGQRVRDLSTMLDYFQKPGKLVLEGVYKNFPGEYKYIFKQ